MGVVYKAEDTSLRRTVALAPQHLHDPRGEPGAEFLVMELLEGQPVKERIEARPLPLEEALEIATQAARGSPSSLSFSQRGVIEIGYLGHAYAISGRKPGNSSRKAVIHGGLGEPLRLDPRFQDLLRRTGLSASHSSH